MFVRTLLDFQVELRPIFGLEAKLFDQGQASQAWQLITVCLSACAVLPCIHRLLAVLYPPGWDLQQIKISSCLGFI